MSLEKNDKIVWVEIEKLKSHPKNSNKHPQEQIERLAKIINYQGFRNPITVSNLSGYIVAGHGRLEAAKNLKLTKVPVSYQDFTDEKMELAHLNADNAIALWATIDMQAVTDSLKEVNFDLDLDFLGFKDFKLEDETQEGLTDEDSVPELSENEFGVKLGDIYLLGEHRIMCGDSTDQETVAKLMDGKKADMVFTDPPYGIEYSSQKQNLKTSNKFEVIKNDDGNLDLTFLFRDKVENKVIWGANCFPSILPHRGRWICWYKRGDGAENALGSPFELAWTNQTSGYDKFFKIVHGGFVNSDGGKRVHPTQKPTELAIKCFEIYNPKLVLDYFLGSGSTLIACEKTNRKCYGMELDPHYCSVIIKRWQDFTGQTATKL